MLSHVIVIFFLKQMVMEIPETVISTECVSEHEVKQFKEVC